MTHELPELYKDDQCTCGCPFSDFEQIEMPNEVRWQCPTCDTIITSEL